MNKIKARYILEEVRRLHTLWLVGAFLEDSIQKIRGEISRSYEICVCVKFVLCTAHA
jgi:hypothetical protein